ncbi:MAG TPA: VWA domain-containing protein [Xanthobacteraceae bacterium]|nr:VWA domain-containing protein [Xanthobacteraceae bacterium]
MRRYWLVGLFALAAAFSLSSGAKAQTGDTILILDASGSMWGQVEGQTKISAARKAVDSILSKWKATDRLGLMTYGHRTKGDCRDIELVVPVSAFDPEKIRSAVKALNPKGKTPMADSLRAAADALRATENKATVILVSDGIETCAPDPCAAAAELKKAGINFTAHVIGFDVTDPVAKSQLQCIARVTGGVYLDASNASGLENALGKAVQATQGTKVETQAPPPPSKSEPDPLADKNFRGIARLAAGADPISDTKADVTWTFLKSNNGQRGDFVSTAYNSPAAEAVEPGDYIVVVKYGQVEREFPFKVEKGKISTLDVSLDAGFVTSDGSIEGAGKADNVTWEVHQANGEIVTTVYDALPRFVLPAGNYTLTLTKGAAKTKKEFSIAAGDSINVSMVLDAGKLAVSAVYAPGGPQVQQGIAVEVRQPAKNDVEKPVWIATLYDPISQFDLPAGRYEVVVSVGYAKRVFPADVKSGDTTRLNFNLDAGVLGSKVPEGSTIEIFSAERDINNQRTWIGTYYEADHNVALNAGNYVVVVTTKSDKKSEHPISVTAGKRVEISVK